MTTAQVVETSVTVNDNIPIQDHVHPDDQTQPTFETSSAVLSHGAFHLVCSHNFWVCGWNTIHGVTMISHRPSSTWYYLFTILVLTFESVDEILWFDHWKRHQFFLVFYKIEFANTFPEFLFWNPLKEWIILFLLIPELVQCLAGAPLACLVWYSQVMSQSQHGLKVSRHLMLLSQQHGSLLSQAWRPTI